MLKRTLAPLPLFLCAVFFGMVLAAAWGFYVNSACSPEKYNEETIPGQGNANQDQGAALDPAATLQSATPPVNDQQPRSLEGKASNLFCGRLSDILIALFTYCLFVVGGFQAWWMMHTVRVADKTAERQLRAYLSAQPGGFMSLEIGKPAHCIVYVHNSGQTPASNVEHYSGISILQYPLPANFQMPVVSGNAPSKTTIHPNAAIGAHTTSLPAISQNDVFQLQNSPNMRVYIYGTIAYWDIFGQSQRTTYYCVWFPSAAILAAQAAIAGGAPTPFQVEYYYCDRHNDAD